MTLRELVVGELEVAHPLSPAYGALGEGATGQVGPAGSLSWQSFCLSLFPDHQLLTTSSSVLLF